MGGLGDFRHANPTLDPNTNPILRPPPLSLHWIIVEYGWMAGAAWLPSDTSIEIWWCPFQWNPLELPIEHCAHRDGIRPWTTATTVYSFYLPYLKRISSLATDEISCSCACCTYVLGYACWKEHIWCLGACVRKGLAPEQHTCTYVRH